MPVVILPGRNKVVAAAFAQLRKEQKKASKAEEVPAAEPGPAKKAGKKPAKKGRKA